MIITKPGIYTDVSNDDYHASHGLSNSSMSDILPPNCPYYYWYKHLSGHYERKETKAFDIGTAVHTRVLEPDKFDEQFYVIKEWPKGNSALAKAGKEQIYKKADGRIVLDKVQRDQIEWMSQNLMSHAMWKALKGDKTGQVENSICWPDEETGVLLRSRPDFYTDDLILDVKTTRGSSPREFSKSVEKYSYHRQGALTIDGLNYHTKKGYENVVLFIVDKEPPHFIRCYVIDDNAIEQGRYEYKYASDLYNKCLTSHNWPKHKEIIEQINIPDYAYRSFE